MERRRRVGVDTGDSVQHTSQFAPDYAYLKAAIQRVRTAHVPLSPDDMLTLQQTIGNRAVQCLLAERRQQEMSGSAVETPIEDPSATEEQQGASLGLDSNNTMQETQKRKQESPANIQHRHPKPGEGLRKKPQTDTITALLQRQAAEVLMPDRARYFLPSHRANDHGIVIPFQKQGRVVNRSRYPRSRYDDPNSEPVESLQIKTTKTKVSR